MKKISKNKLNSLLEKNSKVLLADMRSPVEFRDGHLDKALNLPLRNFINKIMGLPRDTVIIAYSTNYNDVDLERGVNYATQLGFAKLFVAEYDQIK